MKATLKSAVRALSLLCAVPALCIYWCKSLLIGPDAAVMGSSQSLGLIPGLAGRYIRNAFFRRVLAHCDPTATIEFGVIFSQTGARLGRNAYIGPHCHLGLADVGEDALIAAGVHVPSGADTHGTARLDIPVREQPGTRRMVRIGAGSWVGAASVIMANVGEHSIVGAGSIVVKPLPPYSVAVGVPAKVLRDRREVGSLACASGS